MCGYFAYRQATEVSEQMLDALAIADYPTGPRLTRRVVDGLITQEDGHYATSSALWWFAQKKTAGVYAPDWSLTTFNARSLEGPYWRRFLKNKRGIFLASEIGESNPNPNRKTPDRYLMQAKRGLVLAAVYNDWHNDDGSTVRSMAVITRPPHERFSQYHQKSMPCFLPADADFIQHWLDPTIGIEDPALQDFLANPQLTEDLCVQQVKTYTHAQPIGEPALLSRDQ